MSMTGRMIDEMREQADAGCGAAQKTLSAVGLWQSAEEVAATADYDAHFIVDETDEDDLEGENFAALDSAADGETLASAGFGTDEDYGWCGDFDDF